MWRLRRRRVVTAIGVLVAVAVAAMAALTVRASLAPGGQWLTNLGVGVPTAAALIMLYGSFAVWAARTAPLQSEQMDAAADALADAQTEQWSAEECTRRISEPWPLPVRWDITPHADTIMATWAAIRATPGAVPIPLAGEFTKVADVFTTASFPRRLVILGEAGTGTTELALRLVLDLLAQRKPTDPVPVLLPVAGWDPGRRLEDWIAEQLAADHRWLAAPANAPRGDTRTLAANLVSSGRILPVLDGMDEMAPAHHAPALRAIGRFLTRGRQLVLTCRTADYAAAVAAAGPLIQTPVVEIQPLDRADVAAYLAAALQPLNADWQDISDHLACAAATDPLVTALSKPLTVWLCRAVYENRLARPSDLLTAPWAATSTGIEDHLLRELTRALYQRPTHGHDHPTAVEIEYNRRYAANLARHLHAENTHDIAWWQIQAAVPRLTLRTVTALSSFLIAGLVTSLGFNVVYGPGIAAPAAAITAAVLGLTAFIRTGSAHPPTEIRVPSRRHSPGTIAAAAKSGLLWGTPPGLATMAALNAIFGLAPAITGGLATATAIGLARAAIVATRRCADHRQTASPAHLLRRARTAALFSKVLTAVGWSLTTGLATLLAAPIAVAPAASLGIGLTLGTAIGLATLTHTSWGQFCLTRILLAATKRMPLRLMRFLDDAHQRGLLRQSGGVYQFRHNRLRDALAQRV